MLIILGTDGHGFEKGTAGLRDGNGLISLKAILKYRHGSLPQSKLSRELAQASCNHEVPWINTINAEPSRVFIENKAVDFRAKIKSVIIKYL